MIHAETDIPGAFAQTIHVGAHILRADVSAALGGADVAPGPHDLFDASLAACKSLTAHWYAKRNGIPLERVEVHVERDDSRERAGVYVLRVRLAFHGPLSAAERERLYDVVSRCPVHKLMTSVEVTIETAPLG